MNILLIDLHYLPSVSRFAKILAADKVLLEKSENFVKNTGRNRCEIATPEGRLMLSIPVQGGKDHHQKYADVKINYEHTWQKDHWQSLRSAYRRSVFFEYYEDRIEPFYHTEFPSLYDFNLEMLQLIFRLMKVDKAFSFTEEFIKTPDVLEDARQFKKHSEILIPPYQQTFSERTGFLNDLSIVDLLFSKGPATADYLAEYNAQKTGSTI